MDPRQVAQTWLDAFATRVSSQNAESVLKSVVPDGWLRDVLVFSLDNRSLGTHEKIRAYLNKYLPGRTLTNFALDERPSLAPASCPLGSSVGIELSFTFETPNALCRGLARIKSSTENQDEWKSLSLFLMVDAWKGHEEIGPELGIYEGHTISWEDVHAERAKSVGEKPYVVIGPSNTFRVMFGI
jgi:hypothetical protein